MLGRGHRLQATESESELVSGGLPNTSPNWSAWLGINRFRSPARCTSSFQYLAIWKWRFSSVFHRISLSVHIPGPCPCPCPCVFSQPNFVITVLGCRCQIYQFQSESPPGSRQPGTALSLRVHSRPCCRRCCGFICLSINRLSAFCWGFVFFARFLTCFRCSVCRFGFPSWLQLLFGYDGLRAPQKKAEARARSEL